jgi:hypothetical protein
MELILALNFGFMAIILIRFNDYFIKVLTQNLKELDIGYNHALYN